MSTATHSLQALLLTLAGLISRHQQQVIEFLVEENRVLREQLGEQALATLRSDGLVHVTGKARGMRYRVGQDDEEQLRVVELTPAPAGGAPRIEAEPAMEPVDALASVPSDDADEVQAEAGPAAVENLR